MSSDRLITLGSYALWAVRLVSYGVTFAILFHVVVGTGEPPLQSLGVLLLLVAALLATRKVGAPFLWTIATALPASAGTRGLALLLRMTPFLVARRAASVKIRAILQELTGEDARSVEPRLRRLLYRYCWHGPPQGQEAMVRLAVLSVDRSALPYLRKAQRSRDSSVDLRAQIDDAIRRIQETGV